ncbi:hypothetical protein ACQPW1_10255 [Nocardia sp. CA-128927]|uniref:hypothetical protein n=1 Tax=Nocardia sp. CA-128927 TaxID=3239975 RepID=UPI003D99EAC9
MIDPVSVGIVGATFSIGFIAGRVRRQPASKPAVVARCSCRHAYSLHSDDGTCHGRRQSFMDWMDWFDGYNPVPCECQRYDGPIPLEHFLPSMPYLPPTPDA